MSVLSAAAYRGLTEAWRSVTGVLFVGDACEGSALRELEDAGFVDQGLVLTPAGQQARLSALTSPKDVKGPSA